MRSGESTRRVCFRLPGSDGSNYPRPPLSVNLTYALCTYPVVRNHATPFSRPERSNDPNWRLILLNDFEAVRTYRVQQVARRLV